MNVSIDSFLSEEDFNGSKEGPGAGNFVTAVQWPGQFNTADVNLTEQVFPLAQLCNANKSSRIKFVLQDRD